MRAAVHGDDKASHTQAIKKMQARAKVAYAISAVCRRRTFRRRSSSDTDMPYENAVESRSKPPSPLVLKRRSRREPERTVADKSRIKDALREMPRRPAQWTGPEHSHPMLRDALPKSERRFWLSEPGALIDPGFSSWIGIASAANRGDQRIHAGRDSVDASLCAVRLSPNKGWRAFHPNRLRYRHVGTQTFRCPRARCVVHAPGLLSGDELVGGLAQERKRAPRALTLVLVIEYG